MSRWRPITTTIVCLVALGLSAFLTWAHYFDQAAITNSCPLEGHSLIDCGAVTGSPQSVIFHLPVALYGLVYWIAMLAMCLPVAWRSTSQRLAQLRVASVLAGMGFVLYLVYVEFLEIRKICLYCTGVHILQFSLFLLVVTGWYDTGYAQSLSDEDYSDDLAAA
jgi:uncharacterized membrane protein